MTRHLMPLMTAVLLAWSARAELSEAPALHRGSWPDSVRIAAPPGPGGTAPQFAIGHNHHVGDGPLGSGFQLMGTSVITRHGGAGGVPLSAEGEDESTFRIDGVPLLQIDDGIAVARTRARLAGQGPVPLVSDHHYEPETFNGSRLTYDDNTNTWTMENAGWTWTYGSTSGTGVHATKKRSPYWDHTTFPSVVVLPTCPSGNSLCQTVAWHLSKTVDPAGNVVIFDYEVPAIPAALSGRFNQSDTGDHLIKSVRYAADQARIDFEWVERPDPRFVANLGLPTVRAHRLSTVRSFGRNDTEFAAFRVQYKDETGADCDGTPFDPADQDVLVTRPTQSLVQRIERLDLAGGASQVLRCFETHHAADAWDPAETLYSDSGSIPDGRSVIAIPANLDGDGATDLIVLHWTCAASGSVTCSAAHRVYLADPDGAAPFLDRDTATGDDKDRIDLWEETLAEHVDDAHAKYERGFLIGDVDGDMIPDLLTEASGDVWLIKGPTGTSSVSVYEATGIDRCILRHSQLADVDGDGRVDLIRTPFEDSSGCIDETETWWTRNTGSFPYFDWADAEPLHVPLEATHLPEEWDDLMTPGPSEVCDGAYLTPPKDYLDQASDPSHVSTHARFGDFNGDGLIDIAYALYGCFEWTDLGVPEDHYAPVEDSLYSRIFYGTGDGEFVDSGLSAGRPAVQYQVSGTGDGPYEEINPNPIMAADVNRSGLTTLLRGDIDVVGLEGGLDRGLIHGFALDASTGRPADLVMPRVARGSNPRVEASTIGDFDGDGFMDALSVHHTNGTVSMLLARSSRTIAQGRVTERRGRSGGATALTWGFSARHDNPDLPANVEVLDGLDGAQGAVEFRYGLGVWRDGFVGFGYAERQNARGGVDAYSYFTDQGRKGEAESIARYRGDGTLERYRLYLRGQRTGSGGYMVSAFPPYFNPVIRQCEFEIGHGYAGGGGPLSQSVTIEQLITTCNTFDDPFVGGQDDNLVFHRAPLGGLRIELAEAVAANLDPPMEVAEWVKDAQENWQRIVVNTPEAVLIPQLGAQLPIAIAAQMPNSVPASPVARDVRRVGADVLAEYVVARGIDLLPLSFTLSPQPMIAAVNGPWKMVLPFEPWTFEPDPDALRWATPEGTPLPSAPALPQVGGLPITAWDGYITDWLFDAEARRLDARYDHQDITVTEDDRRSAFTWDKPHARGFWYRLLDAEMYDHAGAQHKAVHRRDFVQFDHAETVTTCGDAGMHCRSEQFTFHPTGELASRTFANGDAEAWTYAWCGRLASHTDGVGRVRSFTLDDRCRVSGETYHGATTSFAYDGFNRRTVSQLIPGGGALDVTVSTLYDDDFAYIVDDAFEEPRLARLRSDGQLELVYRDEYGRVTREIVCEDAGPASGGTGILAQVSCAADSEVISQWKAYSNDGLLTATASAHRPSETPPTTRYAHDAHGRVQVALRPAPVDLSVEAAAWVEHQTTFGPGWIKRLDPLGRATYERSDTLERSVSVAGATQQIERFDAFGRLLESEAADGALTLYDYDGFHQLEAVRFDATADCIDGAGTVTACTWEESYAYDTRGRRTDVTAPDGVTRRASYDAVGRPLAQSVEDSAGVFTTLRAYTYDDAAQQVSILDETGSTLVRQHDALGRPTSETLLGLATTWTYAVNGKPASITDPNGLTTAIEYDALDRAIRIDNPRAGLVERTFDGAGRMLTSTDADGVVRAWSWLYSGHLGGKSLGDWQIAAYTRDAAGRAVETWTDGALNHHTYDAHDNVTRVERGVDPDSSAVASTIDFTYDAAHRVLTESVSPVAGGSAVTAWSYDPWGRVDTLTQPNGGTVDHVYDVEGRLRQVTDAEGHTVERQYDRRGRIVYEELPGRGDLTVSYSAATSIDGVANLRRMEVTDGEGDTTQTWRDALGRVRFKQLADGTQRRYTYDGARHTRTDWLAADGTVLREKRRNFDATTGRLSSIEGPAEPAEFSGTVYSLDYTWTDAARLASVTTPGETTLFEYDADGMLETEEYAGLTRTLSRDGDYPWVTSQTLIGAGATRLTTVTRDFAGRPISKSVSDATNPSELHTWGDFDALDRPGTETATVGADVIEHQWTYNVDGTPAERETFDGATSLGVTTWAWYDNGVLQSIDTPSGRHIEYDYGAAFDHELDRVHDGAGHDYAIFQARNGRGQATRVRMRHTIRRFDYDALGRTVERSSGPVFGPPDTVWTGIYDGVGKLEFEEYTAPDGAWINEYTYDSVGRLVEEVHGKSGKTYTYALDLAGNRLSTIIDDGVTIDTTLSAVYTGDTLDTVNGVDLVYDDWNGVLEDQRGQLIERTASGRIEAIEGTARHTFARDVAGMPVRTSSDLGDRYTNWGLSGGTWPLEVEEPGGNVLTYVEAEGLLLERLTTLPTGGSLRAGMMTDSTGTIDRFQNDSQGDATAFGADLASFGNERYRFQKLAAMPGVDSVMLARQRAYDAETGRFLSPDPTGLRGGAHRTLYANGDPVQFHDPLGLVAVMIDGVMHDLHASTVQAMLTTGVAQYAHSAYQYFSLGPIGLPQYGCGGTHSRCELSQAEPEEEEEDDSGDEEESTTHGTGGTEPEFMGFDQTGREVGIYRNGDGEWTVGEEIVFDEAVVVTGEVDGTEDAVGPRTDPEEATPDATDPGAGGTGEVPSPEMEDAGGGAIRHDYWSTRRAIVDQIVQERIEGLGEAINGAIGGLKQLADMAANPVDTFMNHTPAGLLIQGDVAGAGWKLLENVTAPARFAIGIGVSTAKAAGRALIAPFELPYRGYQFFLGQDEATIRAGANGYIDSVGASIETISNFSGVGALGRQAVKEGVRGAVAQGVKNLDNLPAPPRQNFVGGRGRGAGGGTLCCFTADTLVLTADGPEAIVLLRVGRRVLTPGALVAPGETSIDPKTWKHIQLEMADPTRPGDVVLVDLLRSDAWVEAQGALVGELVSVDLTEIGVQGAGKVIAIGPVPPIDEGSGRVVTATITHQSADVRVMRLDDGSVLEPSGAHPFWSADRGTWVPAGKLVKGERVVTLGGLRFVESIARKRGVHAVYNLEVEAEHVYFVGDAYVLVHNACDLSQADLIRKKLRAEFTNNIFEERVMLFMHGTTTKGARFLAGEFASKFTGMNNKLYLAVDPQLAALFARRSVGKRGGGQPALVGFGMPERTYVEMMKGGRIQKGPISDMPGKTEWTVDAGYLKYFNAVTEVLTVTRGTKIDPY